jgi:methionine-rich copper-binding protein CopC
MKAKTTLLAGGLLAAFLTLGSSAAAAVFHFELQKSEPAADATVKSPEAVRLFFSEAPEEGSVSIHVIAPSGEPVETGETTADEHDKSVYSVPVGRALPAGSYTVAWRGIGDDGHVVRGNYSFAVSAE